MPTVPSYEPNAVATEVGRPNFARNNFDAGPAARAGRALSNAGGTLLNIGLVEQRKADDTQLLEANRKLTQWEIEALDKPETGALSRKGKDALGLPDTVLPAYDKYRSEIEAGLNARAKARFAAVADGRRQDVERKLFDHVGRQSDALNVAETEANAATALTSVAVNWKDPKRIETEADLGWAGQYALLERNGAPPAAVKMAREAWDAKVKGTVLDQMLANRDPLALDFYKQNRAALGATSDDYAKQVDQLQLQINETAETDRIVGQFGTGPEALSQARTITDPVLRERVESRIDREQMRVDRARTEADKAIRDYSWNVVGQLPVGASWRTAMTPKQQVAVQQQPGLAAELDREEDRRLAGTETRTNPNTYDLLQRLSPEELATTDLTQYYGDLSPADRDSMAKRQAEARDPKKQAQFATEADQLTIAYGDLGLIGEKKAAKRVEFEKAYREDLRVWMQNNKREPTAEERRKLINGLKLPFAKKNTFLGFETGTTQKPAYQITDKERGEFSVPEEERAKFLRLNPKLTEDELKRAYIILKTNQ